MSDHKIELWPNRSLEKELMELEHRERMRNDPPELLSTKDCTKIKIEAYELLRNAKTFEENAHIFVKLVLQTERCHPKDDNEPLRELRDTISVNLSKTSNDTYIPGYTRRNAHDATKCILNDSIRILKNSFSFSDLIKSRFGF